MRYVLQELSGEGHVGFPEAGVVERTAELTQISADVVREAVEHERTAGEVVREPQARRAVAVPQAAVPGRARRRPRPCET